MQPKISVIIPHWSFEPAHDELLRNCARSFPPEVYEKLVIVNNGTGMGRAINKGFELATGDYFLPTNNDCVFRGGNILDMCDPEAVTLPDQMDGQRDNVPRCFYCIPRWVYEKIGGYDEQYTIGYFEDDDLMRRLRDAGVPVRVIPSLNVFHEPGHTLDKMPDRDGVYKSNQAKYEAKWGELPDWGPK